MAKHPKVSFKKVEGSLQKAVASSRNAVPSSSPTSQPSYAGSSAPAKKKKKQSAKKPSRKPTTGGPAGVQKAIRASAQQKVAKKVVKKAGGTAAYKDNNPRVRRSTKRVAKKHTGGPAGVQKAIRDK